MYGVMVVCVSKLVERQDNLLLAQNDQHDSAGWRDVRSDGCLCGKLVERQDNLLLAQNDQHDSAGRRDVRSDGCLCE